MGRLRSTAIAMPTSQASGSGCDGCPGELRVAVTRQRGRDQGDEDRERREPDGPVDQRDRTRRQRDRREVAGRGLGRAPRERPRRGRCSSCGPRATAPSPALLTADRPAVRARARRPAPRRCARVGNEGNPHPGALERPGLGLRLDRPVADSGQVEDRQLQDEHHEQKLDHPGKCKASRLASS